MTIIFMHHDIIDPDLKKKSGFYGAGAEVYKVSVRTFREQLAGLAAAFPGQAPALDGKAPFFLTFDDGGVSATEIVAGLLSEYGWSGQFFVVTGFIGMPGFMSASGLRALKAGGHCVGTHTVSHPDRLRALPYAHIKREWVESRARLQDLLGCDVTSGSVPGGFCNRPVREAAIEAGLTLLMTSEPTTRCYATAEVTICGRFAVLGRDEPKVAVALARRVHARRIKAWRWHTLSVAKSALGPVYPVVREGLLRLHA